MPTGPPANANIVRDAAQVFFAFFRFLSSPPALKRRRRGDMARFTEWDLLGLYCIARDGTRRTGLLPCPSADVLSSTDDVIALVNG